MKVLAYTLNGRLCIVRPAKPSTTVAQLRRAVPAGVTAVELDAEAIPQDRAWRDAWKLDGDAVAVDLDQAKAIHVQRLESGGDPLDQAKIDAIDAAADLDELEGIK